MMEIGRRNNAPTSQHATQDIYIFSIDLSRAATPLCFEQSIGGGHVEQGGARWLALDELEAWPGVWREHLQKADCAWVAEMIDANPRADQLTMVSLIVQHHSRKKQPVGRLKAVGGWLKRHFHIGGRYGV